MPKNQCAACQELTQDEHDLIVKFEAILKEYIGKPGALIPALQIAQKMIGYLPGKVIKMISRELKEPLAKVYGVATFYSFFTLFPRGKHLIRVCLGTACYVRGGKGILDAFKKELGIDIGQTTADRRFTLQVVRCFGACGQAPAVMVNDDTHQRVKPAKISEILAQYK